MKQMKKEKDKEKKFLINIDDLDANLKTKCSTIRHALERKGLYLPNHKKNYTSLHYMKEIIGGTRIFILKNEVN